MTMVSLILIQCAIQYLDAIKAREEHLLKAQTDPATKIRPDVKEILLDTYHTDEVSSWFISKVLKLDIYISNTKLHYLIII